MGEKEFKDILENDTDKLFTDSLVETVLNSCKNFYSSVEMFGWFFTFGIVIIAMGIGAGIDWIRNVGIGWFIFSLLYIPVIRKKEKTYELQKKILKDYIFALKKKEDRNS